MNNSECQYLYEILENTFENTKSGCLQDDCRAELLNAVEGVDRLLTSLQDRLDSVEADVKRHDDLIAKRAKEIDDIRYRLNEPML
jgi:hypothetical protein